MMVLLEPRSTVRSSETSASKTVVLGWLAGQSSDSRLDLIRQRSTQINSTNSACSFFSFSAVFSAVNQLPSWEVCRRRRWNTLGALTVSQISRRRCCCCFRCGVAQNGAKRREKKKKMVVTKKEGRKERRGEKGKGDPLSLLLLEQPLQLTTLLLLFAVECTVRRAGQRRHQSV